MSRKIIMFLLYALVITIIAACSGGGSSEPSSNGTPTNNTTPAPSSETATDRPTIDFFVNEHPSWPSNPDHIVWGLMEEGGNININLKIAAEPYLESINLVIASGDLPDMIHMPNYLIGNRYGSQGALVNILDYIDMMPNLQKFMNDYPEHAQRALSHDGKMYCSKFRYR